MLEKLYSISEIIQIGQKGLYSQEEKKWGNPGFVTNVLKYTLSKKKKKGRGNIIQMQKLPSTTWEWPFSLRALNRVDPGEEF